MLVCKKMLKIKRDIYYTTNAQTKQHNYGNFVETSINILPNTYKMAAQVFTYRTMSHDENTPAASSRN